MPSPNRQKRPRGQPYYDQLDNGVYYVFWSDGRRSKRSSLGTREDDEAQTRFAQWILLGAGKRRDGTAGTTYTLADLWQVYDIKHVQLNVMPKGRETIAGAWKNLGPFFGPFTVPEFCQARVDEYVARRSAGKIGARPAAPATVRREIATLLAAINFCAGKRGGKLINAADVEDIDLPPDSPPRDRWLRMGEVQRLLDAAAAGRRGERMSRIERFLWLALFTAARKEALLDLTWDRVDFETSTIHLNVPGRKLTKKRRADVTIATQLRPVLERMFAERTTDFVLDHQADDLWASLQYVAIRAGFSNQKVGRGKSPKGTGISPHVLRHTAATHMARRGVPLWKIGNILGDSLATVEKTYAKWAPENPEGTVDQIFVGVLEAAE